MFHWICPECGQEIAPGVKECPVCEPQASPVSSPPVVSPAASNPAAPAVAPVTSSVALARPLEPLAIPRSAPLTEPKAITPAEILPRAETARQPETQASKTVENRTRSAPPEPETFADRLADLAEHLHADPVPYTPPAVAAREAGVVHQAEKRPTVIEVKPAQPLLAPPASVRLLAEPKPPSVAGMIRAKRLFPAQPGSSDPLPGNHAPANCGFGGFIHLPKAAQRGAAPSLAHFQDYREAAESQMRWADSSAQPATKFVAPGTSLPGPALPRELTSLQAAGLVPIRTLGAEAAAGNQYGWVARMAVLAIFLTAGLAAAYRVMPSSTPAKTAATPVSQPVAEEPAPPRPANSLARLVEVTGIRFLEVNKKPQIHYLVVNHSSSPLASMTVYVTLHTAHPKPGQPPLARLTFQSPHLAAFEAKEMASPIERVLGPLELPDWQDLRADVDVQ